MADITIPDLDDAIIQKLKQRAWQSGLPLEEFLRRLLVDAAWPATQERRRAPARAFEDGLSLN